MHWFGDGAKKFAQLSACAPFTPPLRRRYADGMLPKLWDPFVSCFFAMFFVFVLMLMFLLLVLLCFVGA